MIVYIFSKHACQVNIFYIECIYWFLKFSCTVSQDKNHEFSAFSFVIFNLVFFSSRLSLPQGLLSSYVNATIKAFSWHVAGTSAESKSVENLGPWGISVLRTKDVYMAAEIADPLLHFYLHLMIFKTNSVRDFWRNFNLSS